MKLAVSLLAGLVAICAVMAAAAFVSMSMAWSFGIVVAIVGSLATMVLAYKWWRPSLAWAGLLALPAGVLAGMDAAAWADLSRSPHARDVLVAEAPAHADAAAFSFRDGTVRADLWGKSTRAGRSRRDFWAAPVTGEGWTDDQPVTVWAVCDQMFGCKKEWSQPFRAGVRPSAPVSEHFGKAIADAETSRRLATAPDAAMIIWVPSVEQAIAEPLERLWFGVELWTITFVVTLVIWSAVAAWRRRSRPGPASAGG